MYPSPDELRVQVLSGEVDGCVEQLLADETPFAFSAAPEQLQDLRELVLERIGVPPTDVTVVGSGRYGFSLDPGRWGVAFSDASDIDLVVVSDHLYHRAWTDMARNWKKAQLADPRVFRSVERHRKQLVFYGRLIPDELPGITAVARVWFELFSSVGTELPALARRDVRAQLWHCWDHAKLYYRNSLNQLTGGEE